MSADPEDDDLKSVDVNAAFHALQNGYEDWKKSSQAKMKEREKNLMQFRCRTLLEAVRDGIAGFAQDTGVAVHIAEFEIDSQVKQETLDAVQRKLNSWQGVRTARLKKDIKSFQHYLSIGKNWFDQNKIKIWATFFWAKILRHIHEFAVNATHTADHARYLELHIVVTVFKSTVQFAHTKKLPLIPNGTVKTSVDLQKALLELDASLDILAWRKAQTQHQKQQDALHNETHKRTGDAADLCQQLRQTLHLLLMVARTEVLAIVGSGGDTSGVGDRHEPCEQRVPLQRISPMDVFSRVGIEAFRPTTTSSDVSRTCPSTDTTGDFLYAQGTFEVKSDNGDGTCPFPYGTLLAWPHSVAPQNSPPPRPLPSLPPLPQFRPPLPPLPAQPQQLQQLPPLPPVSQYSQYTGYDPSLVSTHSSSYSGVRHRPINPVSDFRHDPMRSAPMTWSTSCHCVHCPQCAYPKNNSGSFTN
eukprot:CAMPEP_0202702638 /NCGR_PEP_ID=MMETSP1385-20130828/15590_1 /ASSEMBLY_ACC=CAM_ASM_000861 /TAXON_ID=933848 /ORGANISM="Elphidium margaritaceum" /LENGTH=469 /DNA_ID=CAMNT_0049360323 /DNA_START=26 /DNA_END=1435 /DNA_ORIENTATION=-